jgi:type III secretion protein L
MEREQSDRLADCELLALQLARVALARILGERESYTDLVSAALGRQLAQLKRDLAVGARVSPLDFADPQSLAALAEAHAGIAVITDPDLAAGECVLDLKLGELDLGIPGQWQRLTGYFDELADGKGRE